MEALGAQGVWCRSMWGWVFLQSFGHREGIERGKVEAYESACIIEGVPTLSPLYTPSPHETSHHEYMSSGAQPISKYSCIDTVHKHGIMPRST